MNKVFSLLVLLLLTSVATVNLKTEAALTTDMLILHYRVDDIDGAGNSADSTDTDTTWADLTGNSNNGTLTNFSFVDGSGWNSGDTSLGSPSRLDFDGTNDFISIINESNFDFANTDPFTIELFYRGNGGESTLYSKVDPANNDRGYELNVDSSGLLQFSLLSNIGLNNAVVVRAMIGTEINDLNWHQVVVTYDGSLTAAGIKLYIDGVEVVTDAVLDLLVGPTENDITPTIGEGSSLGFANLNGAIGAVRIYDKELSSVEVLANFSADNVLFIPTLTLNLVTPLDGSESVDQNTSLTLTFNKLINVVMGNITIYNAIDDSVIEAVDVTSSNVLGNGLSTITVNLTNPLPADTPIYVQVDNTALEDTDGNSFSGIADKTTWNFTTKKNALNGIMKYGKRKYALDTYTSSVNGNDVTLTLTGNRKTGGTLMITFTFKDLFGEIAAGTKLNAVTMSNIENKLVSVTFERDDFVKKVFKTIVTNTSTKARGKLKIIKTDLSDNTLIFRFRFYGKGITCDGTQNDRKRFRLRGKITIDQLADFLD